MADQTIRDIENALNKIVSTTDQNRNMKKEIKKTVYETASTLRNIFHKFREMLDEKTQVPKERENQVTTMKSKLDACESAAAMGHAEASSVQKRELLRTGSRHVLPFLDRNRKLYSSVIAGCADSRYKLTLISRG
jgi:CRISPR/Cas system CSM-associated protein Csm4 (group 5 of RAMP superfamily)